MMRIEQDLTFRDARPIDAGALSQIGRETFVETFGHIYRREDLDRHLDEKFGPAAVAAEIDNPDVEFRLAFAGRRLVAYAKLGPVSLPVEVGERRALELHRLYVRSSEQGLGMGRILLAWVLARARERGAQDLYLGVWQENERAIALYQSRGFETIGAYKYRVGEHFDDEFIMRLRLDAPKV